MESGTDLREWVGRRMLCCLPRVSEVSRRTFHMCPNAIQISLKGMFHPQLPLRMPCYATISIITNGVGLYLHPDNHTMKLLW